MGPIVCATRGGEASIRTQERAITLAKERESELIFLYVVDTSFAGAVSEAMADTLADELRRLGKCLLRLAQTRAREQGLQAKVVVRTGEIKLGIEQFLREVDSSTLIVGSPRTDAGRQTFDAQGLDSFASEIQEATGAEVIVVD